MIFVQFFQKSAISNNVIEATGDRSVVLLDGRNTDFTHRSIAAGECRKRGYVAWQLFKGDSLLLNRPTTVVNYI